MSDQAFEKPLTTNPEALDWAVEKTKLRFTFGVGHQLQLHYDGVKIASVSLRVAGDICELAIAIERQFIHFEFIKKSVVRVAILAAEMQHPNAIARLRVVSAPAELISSFAEFGFVRAHATWELDLDFAKTAALSALKRELLQYANASERVGRGYPIDANRLSRSGVAHLNAEYQEVAWGLTNWARHADIGSDELAVIHDYCRGERGVEVGAGSGRLTRYLAGRFEQLIATDIVPTALAHIAKVGGIEPVVDDILLTKLPSDYFDVVMFWENGLGAFLTVEERSQALVNMCSLLKSGGHLILGLRNLLSQPIDQLMIAAQTDLVMGIYHTFTEDEITALLPADLEQIESRRGLARPAGGEQFFMIFQKRCSL